MDYRVSELCEQVTTARANYRSVRVVGGSTKHFYGNPVRRTDSDAHVLDLRQLSGVIRYEPSELVITAWAGTPLQSLQALLDDQGQMLAFDPPHFGDGATLGGMVASGLSGPAAFGYGPLRHYVLGVTLLDAQGRVLKFGGEVMKNVAGYDVSRLLAGSMGMFGVLLSVSLKVLPKPVSDVTCVLPMSLAEALAMSKRFRASTLPIRAAAWMQAPGLPDQAPEPALVLRLAGAEAAVTHAQSVLGGQRLSDSQAGDWWQALREQTQPFFAQRPLWRVAVRQGTGPLGLGPECFDWAGELRWINTQESAAVVRAAAVAAGGHATLFRVGDGAVPEDGVFQPMVPAVHTIVRGLKNELDPKGIFNPGRLVWDL